MLTPDRTVADLKENATEAAQLLRLLANENRLRLLCVLAGGETTVNDLADAVGLAQSAVSQHLARLRADGLVAFRRDGTALHYRVADGDALRLLGTLRDIYCSQPPSGKVGTTLPGRSAPKTPAAPLTNSPETLETKEQEKCRQD